MGEEVWRVAHTLNHQRLGCPIHAVSSHEWGIRAKREPSSFPEQQILGDLQYLLKPAGGPPFQISTDHERSGAPYFGLLAKGGNVNRQ